MSQREGELKSQFSTQMKLVLPEYIVQHFATAGSPDRSITGGGRTTHWEFKHGVPNFDCKGDQLLMCRRLNVQGHCRYVVWQEGGTGLGPRTLIVTPQAIHQRIGWTVKAEAICDGYNMSWLVEQVRKAHHGD